LLFAINNSEVDLMPIYEYECTNCGLRFERHQHVSDDPVKVCPECAGEARRVFHAVGVIFKGSGFYVTDNRRTSSGGSSRKEKPSDSASTNGSGEGKQESGPKSETEKSHSKV
jgi:putative FmdB family regulatory protein